MAKKEKVKYKDRTPNLKDMSELQYNIAQFIQTQHDTTDIEIAHYKSIWDRAYKLWMRYRKSPTGEKIKRARLFIPLVFNMIETLLPIIVLSLLSVRDFIDVVPTGQEDQTLTKRIKNLISYQIPRIPDFFLKVVKWIKSCLMYGTGIIKPHWTDNRKPVKQKRVRRVAGYAEGTEDDVDKEGKQVEKKVGYFGPDFTFIPLAVFRKDRFATSIKDSRWCSDTKQRSLQHLQNAKDDEGESLYSNLDLVKKLPIAFDLTQGAGQEIHNAIGLPSAGDDGVEDFCKMLEVTDYWGVGKREHLYSMTPELEKQLSSMTDEKKEEIVDLNITLVNMQVPILVRENDYNLLDGEKPYIQIISIVDLESFYGTGDIEPSEATQHAANDVRNQTFEAAQRMLSDRKYVERGANVDLYQLQYAPAGGYVEMDRADAVQSEQSTYPFDAGFALANMFKTEFQETTGVLPSAGTAEPATGGAAGKTATVYMAFREAVMRRFKMKSMLIEHMGIAELGRWIMILNAKYQTDDILFRITGEEDEPIKVTLEEAQRQYDFRAIGSASEPLSSYEARQQNLITVMGVMSQHPEWRDAMNLESWGKDICEVFGIRDYQDKFRNPLNVWTEKVKQVMIEAINNGMPAEAVIEKMIQMPNPMPETKGGTTDHIRSGADNTMRDGMRKSAGKFARSEMSV